MHPQSQYLRSYRKKRVRQMSEARGDFRNRPCHFIGIGGIGMSGLAQMLLSKGCTVTGSDLRENEQTRRLSSLGASILIGHSAQNVPGGATVVYSSAVRPDNPELVTARGETQQVRDALATEQGKLEKARAKWNDDRASLEQAKDALAAALVRIEETDSRSFD